MLKPIILILAVLLTSSCDHHTIVTPESPCWITFDVTSGVVELPREVLQCDRLYFEAFEICDGPPLYVAEVRP